MNSPYKTKPPQLVLMGIKALLVSGAMAGAIGIWGLLANQDAESVDAQSVPETMEDPGMALPTLVSLIDPSGEAAPTGVPPALRTVSALPTATVSVQPAPVQVTNLSGSSNTQSGGNAKKTAKKKSVTRTRSS